MERALAVAGACMPSSRRPVVAGPAADGSGHAPLKTASMPGPVCWYLPVRAVSRAWRVAATDKPGACARRSSVLACISLGSPGQLPWAVQTRFVIIPGWPDRPVSKTPTQVCCVGVSKHSDIRRAADGAAGQRCQLPAASAACGCSTSSPSIAIWISSLTTIRPSKMALKLSPKSFLLILVVAP